MLSKKYKEIYVLKKIVIIGASELQDPLILKAKEMGLETHVFAWEDGSIGEKTADHFYPISITEKDKILEKCMEIKPDAVASIASDLANITVNYLARNLGLTANSERSVLISTNKFEMRKAFKSAGIPTPDFKRIGIDDSLEDIKKMRLPVIVKPTDRSGSRSITKIDHIGDLESAVLRAVNDSFEKKAIVEEYIDGSEYSCECVSYEGKHYFLTITKKFTTGAPHYIETGHIEPSGLDDDTVERVRSVIFKALDALEIRYGASHSEFKIDQDGNINIIEIGSRMGGDCIGSDLVRLSTGYDFVKMVIQIALGEKPEFKRISSSKCAAIKYICCEKDVEHFSLVKEKFPENLVRYTNIGKIDHDVVDSSSRFGFYIIVDSQVEKVVSILGLHAHCDRTFLS